MALHIGRGCRATLVLFLWAPATLGEDSEANPIPVRLTFRSNVSATLMAWDDDESVWRYACTSPCRESAASRSYYRVIGDGLAPTKTFALAPAHDNNLVASMARPKQRAAGLTLMASGSTLATLGALSFFFAGAVGPQTPPQASFTSAPVTAAQANPAFWMLMSLGIISTLASVALIVGGITWMVSMSSSVRLNGGRIALRLLSGRPVYF